MSNSCAACGRQIVTVRGTKKYCGPACRTAAYNRRKRDLPTLVAVPAAITPDAPVVDGDLVATLRSELTELGHEHTVDGLALLALATRIASGVDGASSIASAVDKLRDGLTALRNAQAKQTDILATLRARRESRHG